MIPWIELFDLFTEPSRDEFRHPFRWNGRTCATDGRALILVDKPFDYDYLKETILKLDQALPCDNQDIVIDCKKIYDQLQSCIIICKKCTGCGVYTCPACDSEVECGDCSGTGNHDFNLNLDGVIFNSHVFNKLLMATQMLKVTTMVWFTRTQFGANKFKLNSEVTVVLMSVRTETADIVLKDYQYEKL